MNPDQTHARTGDLPSGRFLTLAALIGVLAGINAFGRLGSEFVTEWDESLYGTAAAEMLQGAGWIATTFHGQLDYSNSKPPLNFWLIALSMKLLGSTLVALRLPAATAAFLTIIIVIKWLRAAFDDTIALLAGLVLSTSFAFFYVHSGRTANADALLTLFIVATVVATWSAIDRPRWFLMVGPLIAAAFLVKGFAALLPLLVVAIGWRIILRNRLPLTVIAGSAILAAVPVLLWMAARWRVDGSAFFRVLLFQDLLNRSVNVIQEHDEGWFFYLDVLQRYQYDWMAAAVLGLCLVAPAWPRILEAWRRPWSAGSTLVAWSCAVLFVVPTVMRTKISWYANPLLPFLAIVIGAALAYALRTTRGWRRAAVTGVIILAALVAESRMVWHSFHRRDLALSDQGLLLAHQAVLSGHAIYRTPWTEADHFLVVHVIGARNAPVTDAREFLSASAPDDFLLHLGAVNERGLREIGNDGTHFLYRRD